MPAGACPTLPRRNGASGAGHLLMEVEMPKYRPIVYDYIENGRPSLEDVVRTRIRENPTKVRAVVPTPHPLAAASAGFKAGKGATSISGGTFSPGPSSGKL